MAAPEFYVAKESATFDYAGQPVFLTAGTTIVRAGHPILKSHEHLFEPLKVHWDHKPAGEEDTPAPASPVRADQRGARTRSMRA